MDIVETIRLLENRLNFLQASRASLASTGDIDQVLALDQQIAQAVAALEALRGQQAG